MFPFSHFFSGYLVGGIMVFSGLLEASNLNFVMFGLVSLLPDLDALWNRKIENHHQTLFHAPLFWILVSALIGLYSPALAILVFSMSLMHVFSDYVTGRTVGIPFMYPFDNEEYSLYPANKETASLDPIRPEKELLKKHISYYLENKKQLLFEVSLMVSGTFCMILLAFQL